MNTTTATSVQITPPPGYRVCARAHPTEEWHVFVPESPGQTTCRLCSATFGTRAVSDEPHLHERKKPTLPPRPCERCEQEYTPNSNSAKYCATCSDLVQREHRAAYQKEKRKAGAKSLSRQRQCTICEKMYWPKSPTAKICHQDACKNEAQRRCRRRRDENTRRAA